jgi:hypothetical protein
MKLKYARVKKPSFESDRHSQSLNNSDYYMKQKSNNSSSSYLKWGRINSNRSSFNKNNYFDKVMKSQSQILSGKQSAKGLSD